MNKNLAVVMTIAVVVLLWGGWIIYVYSTIRGLNQDLMLMEKKVMVSENVDNQFLESQIRTQEIINKLSDLSGRMEMVKQRRELFIGEPDVQSELAVEKKINELNKLIMKTYEIEAE